jgi:hypothetical protein
MQCLYAAIAITKLFAIFRFFPLFLFVIRITELELV